MMMVMMKRRERKFMIERSHHRRRRRRLGRPRRRMYQVVVLGGNGRNLTEVADESRQYQPYTHHRPGRAEEYHPLHTIKMLPLVVVLIMLIARKITVIMIMSDVNGGRETLKVYGRIQVKSNFSNYSITSSKRLCTSLTAHLMSLQFGKKESDRVLVS